MGSPGLVALHLKLSFLFEKTAGHRDWIWPTVYDFLRRIPPSLKACSGSRFPVRLSKERRRRQGLVPPASIAILWPLWAWLRSAGETLRPAPAPCTLVPGAPWGDPVGGDTRGGRVRKWGRGSRELAVAAAGFGYSEVWETPGRSGAGGPPGSPRRRWQRKKVKAPACSAPIAAAGSGEGAGPGCWPRAAGSWAGGGARPRVCRETGREPRKWPKVLSPEIGRRSGT